MTRGSPARLEITPALLAAMFAAGRPKLARLKTLKMSSAERRVDAAVEVDAALNAHVERDPSRPAQDVAAGVAERARRHLRERGGIEPLLPPSRRPSGSPVRLGMPV